MYPSVTKRRTVSPCQDISTSRPRREIGTRDHPPAPSVSGLQMGRFDRRRFAGGMPPANRPDSAQTGDFSNGTFEEPALPEIPHRACGTRTHFGNVLRRILAA